MEGSDVSSNDMSDEEEDEESFGQDPFKPKANPRRLENAAALREYLINFTTEAEKIAGETYSAEHLAERWGKSIVLSDDLKVLEVDKDGTVTDVTQMIKMANTAGLRRSRGRCGKDDILLSGGLLVRIVDKQRVYNCKELLRVGKGRPRG